MASKGASALTGAGTGAAVGTAIMPGVGTAVGAGLGAVGGWLLGDDEEQAPSYTPDAASFQYGVGQGIDANGVVIGGSPEERAARDAQYETDLADINARKQAELAALGPNPPATAVLLLNKKYDSEFNRLDSLHNATKPAEDNAAAQRTRQLVNQQQGLATLAEDAYGRAAPTQAMPGAITQAQSGGQAYLEGADTLSKLQQRQALGGMKNQVEALNAFAGAPEGPSAAQSQLQAGVDMAARQQYGMARSQPGGGGAALRNAAFNAAGISGNAGNEAARLRAQETNDYKARQLAALNAAMGGSGAVSAAAGQARGQDQGFAATQAGQANYDAGATNAFNQAQQQMEFNVGANNLTAAGQARSQNDAMTLGAIGGVQNLNNQIENVSSNVQGGNIAYENAKAQGAGINSANFNQANANSRADMQMGLNAASQGVAAYVASKDAGDTGSGNNPTMKSDERSKKLIKKERALSESLGALDTLGNAPAYSYVYKDPNEPGAAPGRQISSMAQDLERGPRGEEIVSESPTGKMVNNEAVMRMTPGAITELNRKVAALEKAIGRKVA